MYMIGVMETGSSMESDGVWIPLTPGKPALTSERGTGKENINGEFPCTDGFDSMRGYTQKCVVNEMCEFPVGILDELEAGLGVAGTEPKGTTMVHGKLSLLFKVLVCE